MPFLHNLKTDLQNTGHITFVRGAGSESGISISVADGSAQIITRFGLRES